MEKKDRRLGLGWERCVWWMCVRIAQRTQRHRDTEKKKKKRRKRRSLFR